MYYKVYESFEHTRSRLQAAKACNIVVVNNFVNFIIQYIIYYIIFMNLVFKYYVTHIYKK